MVSKPGRVSEFQVPGGMSLHIRQDLAENEVGLPAGFHIL